MKMMKMMKKMDKKSLFDEDIKPSVNLDYVDEAIEENITADDDYHDYDGRESIDKTDIRNGYLTRSMIFMNMRSIKR